MPTNIFNSKLENGIREVIFDELTVQKWTRNGLIENFSKHTHTQRKSINAD